MWQEKLRVHKNNVLADLYPIAKIWIVALYAVASMISNTADLHGYPVYKMLIFLVVPILAAASGVFKKFMTVFNKLLPLTALITVVQAVVLQGDVIYWSLPLGNHFTLHIYERGVQYGLNLTFSIFNIAGILAWFFQSTENKELICALEKKGMSPKSSYVLLSTLQMIPVLQQSAKVIMNAQQARGVETEGNLLVRSKAFFPSMVPLILSAITNTEERVLTLESKGFSVKTKKTRIYDVAPSGHEATAVTLAALFLFLVIVWRILLWVL